MFALSLIFTYQFVSFLLSSLVTFWTCKVCRTFWLFMVTDIETILDGTKGKIWICPFIFIVQFFDRLTYYWEIFILQFMTSTKVHTNVWLALLVVQCLHHCCFCHGGMNWIWAYEQPYLAHSFVTHIQIFVI